MAIKQIGIKMFDSCCVVNEHCDFPANYENNRKRKLPECFCCGLSVCKKCSSKRKYLKYGIKRLCDYCQLEIDGDNYRVMYRIAKLSGYNNRAAKLIAKTGNNGSDPAG